MMVARQEPQRATVRMPSHQQKHFDNWVHMNAHALVTRAAPSPEGYPTAVLRTIHLWQPLAHGKPVTYAFSTGMRV